MALGLFYFLTKLTTEPILELSSRAGNSISHRYPEITETIELTGTITCSGSVVLDGEIVVLDTVAIQTFKAIRKE